MKILTVLGSIAILANAAIVQAQTSSTPSTLTPQVQPDYAGYGNAGYHASTAAEGFFRGLAEMARAGGEYNLYSSMAMINAVEANRRAIDNDQKWLESYFALRRINAERRQAERGQRGTMEDWIRYAQSGKPRRLSPSELDAFTGQVAWPILLRSNDLARHRESVEKVFAERAAMGTISTEEFLHVIKTTADMLAALKQRVHEVPTVPYLAARRFLESLAYEAAQPTTQYTARLTTSALARTP